MVLNPVPWSSHCDPPINSYSLTRERNLSESTGSAVSVVVAGSVAMALGSAVASVDSCGMDVAEVRLDFGLVFAVDEGDVEEREEVSVVLAVFWSFETAESIRGGGGGVVATACSPTVKKWLRCGRLSCRKIPGYFHQCFNRVLRTFIR